VANVSVLPLFVDDNEELRFTLHVGPICYFIEKLALGNLKLDMNDMNSDWRQLRMMVHMG